MTPQSLSMLVKNSKTGHVTIAVAQKDGVRFKTLAKNVAIAGKA